MSEPTVEQPLAATTSAPPDGPLSDVFDWHLEASTMSTVVEQLRRPSDRPRFVVTVNVALLWMASRDAKLSRVVQNAALRVADGMGVIWSWRALGRRLPERIAGIDLMVHLVDAAAKDGRSVYLLGAEQQVIDRLEVVLADQHPGLRIAGSRNGFFSEDDHAAVIAGISESGADLLFIGMPSPFKELWGADHLDEFGADLVMGVGGSFDVIAGFVPRAPTLLQRTGFEWAWRLACEPRRMWKRYAVTNAWLGRRVLAGMLRRRGAPVQPAEGPTR